MVLPDLSDRTSFDPRGIPRVGGSRDVMSRCVILPVAGVLDGGAATAADDDQLLAHEHSNCTMSGGRGYVMPYGEFFHSGQYVSVWQGAAENCGTQAVRD